MDKLGTHPLDSPMARRPVFRDVPSGLPTGTARLSPTGLYLVPLDEPPASASAFPETKLGV